MKKKSAGILLYRSASSGPKQVLLVHPGGPYFSRRDTGVWSIPKGEIAVSEPPLAAALREFREELGTTLSPEGFTALPPVTQKGGKEVWAFAKEMDLDCTASHCNMVTMEFPYKSGRQITFPEIDRAEWFDIESAKKKINAAQLPFIQWAANQATA